MKIYDTSTLRQKCDVHKNKPDDDITIKKKHNHQRIVKRVGVSMNKLHWPKPTLLSQFQHEYVIRSPL